MDGTIDWRAGPPLPADRARDLPELIRRARRRAGSRPALVEAGRPWAWDELIGRAGGLVRERPEAFAPGRRVAILAPNGAAHQVIELAAWLSGAQAAPIHRHQPAPALAELVSRCAPDLVFAAPDVPDLSVHAPRLSTDAALAVRPATPEPARVTPDAPALILFTSGSTGAPRGVLLSHDNLCSQQAAFALVWPEIGPDDSLVAYLPWHHSFGSAAERLWALQRGARLHLAPGEGHDHAVLLELLRRVGPSVFMSVPKLHDLVAREGVDPAWRPRWVFNAGAALGSRAEGFYAARGIRVLDGWGLTEASPSATITPPADPRRPGVVGRPIPGVRVGVRRGDGRVFIAGPGVMLGYLDDPAATAAVLADGVLDSGDVGRWCELGLELIGRSDRMLKHPNGEKIPARELEDRLCAGEGVQAAAVTVADDGVVAVVCASVPPSRLRAVLAACNREQRHSWWRVARCYLRDPAVGAAPETASFKADRAALLAEYRRWRENGGDGFREVTLP